MTPAIAVAAAAANEELARKYDAVHAEQLRQDAERKKLGEYAGDIARKGANLTLNGMSSTVANTMAMSNCFNIVSSTNCSITVNYGPVYKGNTLVSTQAVTVRQPACPVNTTSQWSPQPQPVEKQVQQEYREPAPVEQSSYYYRPTPAPTVVYRQPYVYQTYNPIISVGYGGGSYYGGSYCAPSYGGGYRSGPPLPLATYHHGGGGGRCR